MKNILSTAFITVALAAPAFAQATTYYVVQDSTTKRCTIVDKKPTVTTQVVVSPDGTVYKTRAEAEAGMKTIKVCETK